MFSVSDSYYCLSKRALSDLKKDESIVIMKADKGNCFVVMDRSDYNLKMQALLDDKKTYETVTKNPFSRVERELNSKLLSLKNEGKLDDRTYRSYTLLMACHQQFAAQ